jgi:subtilisin family serine protease
LGADVVNNSWGAALLDPEYLDWFKPAIEVWVAAGVIPVFAQGNFGPDCATAGVPGDLDIVLAVGAVDELNSLAAFSSRGPGSPRDGHARIKPDLVAPGQAILSCGKQGELVSMSGTSMAAPHVTGGVAVLLGAHPGWDFYKVRDVVLETASRKKLREPQLGQQACYGVRWDTFPNYHYGHGLLDVPAMLLKAKEKGKRIV